MKKILLVSPPRGADFPRRDDPRRNEALGMPSAIMPPLDLATLAALTPPDIQVDIWDESVRGAITESTDLGEDYDLMGVTGYMTHMPWALEKAKLARKWGMEVVIGGPGVSGSPERCRGTFDVVFIGEAELTWPEFIADWKAGEHRSEYRQVQRPDIDQSPQPRWAGMGNMSSDYLMGAVQTTRGCPFDCEFCDVIHLFGRQPRHKSIDNVLAEVSTLNDQGMRMVFFCDDNFIGRPKYAKELLKALIPLNNSFDRPMGYTTQLTINVADDDEMLELLADANFHWVLIGIESPREACLREANKPQNVRINLVEAVKKVQSYGVLVKGNMIVGFDHDDKDIFQEIYDFLLECGIVNTGLSLLKAYPGTPLLARMQRDGRLVELGDDIYSDVTRSITNIVPKQMTRVELFEGYKWLFEKMRSWEYFGACAKTMLKTVKRKPKVPRKAPPDPEKVKAVRKAIDGLEPDVKKIVKKVLRQTWFRAPYMMERVVTTTFRFGGVAIASQRALDALQERIDIESAEGFEMEIIRTAPPIPVGFKETMQGEAFDLTYRLLGEGLDDRADLPAGLIRVWKAFLIRWGTTFEAFEDFHFEHLRELCERTAEEGNEGQFAASRVRAETDGLSGVLLRRLAGEVLVSVEQDLRGLNVEPELVTVPLNVSLGDTNGGSR